MTQQGEVMMAWQGKVRQKREEIHTKGFNSMAIMQPLIDAVSLISAQGGSNLKSSCRKASGSLLSFSCCTIAKGLVSNSE